MNPAKIKGLNQDSSEESNDEEEINTISKEVLEQKTQQQYRDALVLQNEEKYDEAEKLLLELLRSDILQQANGKVEYINGKLQASLSHLKYCCFLNLGNIMFKQKKYKSALDLFIKATEVDDTDLNLWYKMGKVAMKIPNLTLAISSFTETLIRNPNHWPSLDSIISAQYAIGDYMSALLCISRALELDSNYLKGIVIKNKILADFPVFINDFSIYYPEHNLQMNDDESYDSKIEEDILQEIETLKSNDSALNSKNFNYFEIPPYITKIIKKDTWICLGKALRNFYLQYINSSNDIALLCPLEVRISSTIDESKAGSMPMEIDTQFDHQYSKANFCGDVELLKNEVVVDDDDETPKILALKINENEKRSSESHKSKRRKCSPTLIDQLRVCDKRRSARNKTVLKSNEQSLTKILQNTIPKNLLPEKFSKYDESDMRRNNDDSSDEVDVYRFLFENHDSNNLPSQPTNDPNIEIRYRRIIEESYFISENEAKDVDICIKNNNNKTVFEFMEGYLENLATKWNLIWPETLIELFVEIQQILIKHNFDGKRIKIIEHWNTETDFNEKTLELLKHKLNVILLYGELLLNNKDDQPLGNSAFGGSFSSLLLGDIHDACNILNASKEHVSIWLRSYWLEAILFLNNKNTNAACNALSMIIDNEIDVESEICLPNVKQFHQISIVGAKRLLNTLYRNRNLSDVRILLSEKRYDEVIEILQETLQPDSQQLMYLPDENILSRYEQYGILLESQLESKKFQELFKWSEVACYEAFSVYRKSFLDDIDSATKPKWASFVMKTISGMLTSLENVGPSIVNGLESDNLCRLIQTLSNLVCHQVEATEPSPEIISDAIAPWILLSNLMKYNENKNDTNNVLNNSFDDSVDINIPPSLKILFVAHEQIGRRGWCCFNEGLLLFDTLKIIESLFPKCAQFSDSWSTLSQEVDQIFYCLYEHPCKKNKPRYVQDHNSYKLALTWSRSIQAYLFYRPETLPEFDSISKSNSITADTESLFTKIECNLPEEQNPINYKKNYLYPFLAGSLDELPKNENKLQEEIADLYYLLADYYFKNKDMVLAMKYYSLDICCNPRRVDSWAALALARGNQMEVKLNSCETISNKDILKKVGYADKCYKMAFELDYYLTTLWIEYGVFCYAIHAFCSRLLKQGTLNLEMFNTVEDKKNYFLMTAFNSFNHANSAYYELVSSKEEVQDERWLTHYFLGKIAEKKEENLAIYLNHYIEAGKSLHENGAEYPSKILYSSPQYYSVEAIEIYYRIHATILKLLEEYEEKQPDSSSLAIINGFLDKVSESPFIRGQTCTAKVFAVANSPRSAEKTTEIDIKTEKNDVTPSLNSLFLSESINENDIEVISDNLTGQKPSESSGSPLACKRKLDDDLPERVISSDFKKIKTEDVIKNENISAKSSSLGSSNAVTSDSSSSSDKSDVGASEDENDNNKNLNIVGNQSWLAMRDGLIEKCIAALLECIRRFPEHYKSYHRLAHYYFHTKKKGDMEKARKYLHETPGGLFSTKNHIFYGIWRIPTPEIDRPGSFAFHMSRSVHLLLDILRKLGEYKVLLQISIQLRCKPDSDKKYLRDDEREENSRESLTLSIQTLKRRVDSLLTEEHENKRKLLLDVYECYQKCTRNASQKDSPYGKLLISVFSKCIPVSLDKITLDQVVHCCKALNNANTITGVAPDDQVEFVRIITQTLNMPMSFTEPKLLMMSHNNHFMSFSQSSILKSTMPPPDAASKASFIVHPSVTTGCTGSTIDPSFTQRTTNLPNSNLTTSNVETPTTSTIFVTAAATTTTTTSIVIPQPTNSMVMMPPSKPLLVVTTTVNTSIVKSQISAAAATAIPTVPGAGIRKKYEKSHRQMLKEEQARLKKHLEKVVPGGGIAESSGGGARGGVNGAFGLSITPVLPKTKFTQPNVSAAITKTSTTGPDGNGKNTVSVSATKIGGAVTLTSGGGNSGGIIITPVMSVEKCNISPSGNKEPTLQEKLVAKQTVMKNLSPGGGSSSSSQLSPSSKPTAFSTLSPKTLEKTSRSLVESGVSIFPVKKDAKSSTWSAAKTNLFSASSCSSSNALMQTVAAGTLVKKSLTGSSSSPMVVNVESLTELRKSIGMECSMETLPSSSPNKLQRKLKVLEQNSEIVISNTLPKPSPKT